MPIPNPNAANVYYKLPLTVAQALVDYLVTKPFNEVADIIVVIQKLEKIEIVPAPPAKVEPATPPPPTPETAQPSA